METLKVLFADKLVEDDREPLFTVSVLDAKWGIFAPQFALWQQLIFVRNGHAWWFAQTRYFTLRFLTRSNCSHFVVHSFYSFKRPSNTSLPW